MKRHDENTCYALCGKEAHPAQMIGPVSDGLRGVKDTSSADCPLQSACNGLRSAYIRLSLRCESHNLDVVMIAQIGIQEDTDWRAINK